MALFPIVQSLHNGEDLGNVASYVGSVVAKQEQQIAQQEAAREEEKEQRKVVLDTMESETDLLRSRISAMRAKLLESLPAPSEQAIAAAALWPVASQGGRVGVFGSTAMAAPKDEVPAAMAAPKDVVPAAMAAPKDVVPAAMVAPKDVVPAAMAVPKDVVPAAMTAPKDVVPVPAKAETRDAKETLVAAASSTVAPTAPSAGATAAAASSGAASTKDIAVSQHLAASQAALASSIALYDTVRSLEVPLVPRLDVPDSILAAQKAEVSNLAAEYIQKLSN